jgi:tRNA(Ile)-lysidine synthase
VARSETRELAALLGLPWIDDPTNMDTSLRRIALRRDVIPYLQTRINPSIRAALIRLAASLDEDERFLDQAAASVPMRIDRSTVCLPAPLLATLPEPVGARVARRALREMHHGYPGSSADAAAVLSVAGGGRPAELTGSLRVERNGVWVVINQPGPSESLSPVVWSLPGNVEISGWTLEAWLEETPPVVFSLSPFEEVFDADTLPASVTVRSMEPGDRIGIVGGTKSLPDVMADAPSRPWQRSNWAVVASKEDVLWVPGARRADFGWVAGSTKRYLWVSATVEGNS